jgi:ATP-dependent DNA helicase PIF1
MNQDQALAIMKTGANVFLTGGPGSGKTHTVNAYVAWLRSHGMEAAVTASTGIAATHIGGMTIHSWSGIGIKTELTPRDLDFLAQNEPLVRRISKAAVLIIDEISMLDARTFQMVDKVCRAARQNPYPFGGLQLVCVGDFFQLPPVSRERRAEFAFASLAWADAAPIICYLDGQYRQDDDAFLSVLSAIRGNGVGAEHREALQARIQAQAEAPADIVKLFSHNADVDRLNDDALARLPGESRSFEMRANGSTNLVAALKRGCLSPDVLKLKVGAAVMCTRNNPAANYVNGTLGTVVAFDKDSGYPVIETRSGSRITIVPQEWSIEEGGKKRAGIEQVPLRLAWAMTVHKSQGMSLDAAHIDLGSAFEYGQGYVALSRVRRLSGLFLIGFNSRALEVHPGILAKDQEFQSRSLTAEDRLSSLGENEREMMVEAFITKSGGKLQATAPQEKTYSVSELRKKHGKAYGRWNEGDEKELLAMHASGTPIKEIAVRLGRQRGGILSRLKKLGIGG